MGERAMFPDSVKRKLPKASLLSVRWAPWSSYWRLARFRLANAHQWQIGPFCVIWRAPWLEGPARALHPHLFEQTRPLSDPSRREEG